MIQMSPVYEINYARVWSSTPAALLSLLPEVERVEGLD